MHRDEFGSASGASFRFDHLGETIEGAITFVGEWAPWVDTQSGRTSTVCKVAVTPDQGEPGVLWVRQGSDMARAIHAALVEADQERLEQGQRIKVRYESDLNTGKPSAMKQYRAKITPAPRQAPAQPASSFAGGPPAYDPNEPF